MRTVSTALCMLFFFLNAKAQQENVPTLPATIIAGFSGQQDSVSLDTLLQGGRITINHKAFKIISFEMSFAAGGCITISGLTKCTGDNLSAEAKQRIKGRPPTYGRLFFEKILVQNTVGVKYYVNSFSVRIKGQP